MTESEMSHRWSIAEPSPPGVEVGRSELPGISRSVEQLLDLRRTGVVMTPDPNRPEEAWGVLNPASARSRDGELYLFPRVVAAGNYSRIAMTAVQFNLAGDPTSVERLGLVLEPQEPYELAGPGAGGVEDPRITFIPLLDSYIMTYVGLGPDRPHIALAASRDLHTWDRLGLLHFDVTNGVDFNRCDNKDCVIFPLPVTDPEGRAAFAILHRPMYRVAHADGTDEWQVPAGVTDRRPSIWISYAPLDRVKGDLQELTHVSSHQLLAQPIGNWEHHHIGSGAPPILSEEGWLLYYHGVIGLTSAGLQAAPGSLAYQSGVMLLDRDDPRRVLYRSSQPVLRPEEPGELQGIVPNVVFPTAVDVRDHRIDVYYGAADERIAVATTRLAASVLLAPSAPPGIAVLHQGVGPLRPAGQQYGHRAQGDVPPVGGVIRDGQDLDDVARSAGHAALVGETLDQPSSRPDRVHRPYGHILFALDGSSFAERVLASVEPLAEKFGSRITLLQALTPVQVPVMAEASAPATRAELPATDAARGADDIRRDAVAYLSAVQRHLEALGLSVESEYPVGPASDVILRRARELGVDLIALTTHGRTGVDRMLLGSVAEAVVRRAPCPVLLVRVQTGY